MRTPGDPWSSACESVILLAFENRMKSWPAALMVTICSLTAAFAGIPPAGFQETSVATGITQITGFDGPNGDLWIISKLGVVRVLHPGAPS